MTLRTYLLPALLAVLAATAGGCIEREGRPVNPCTQVNVAQAIQVTNVDRVDLLLMVDNSNSMTEEQVSLAEQFPDMINILASGDFDQNGSLDDPEDFDPVRDLNVGVITSDMGTAGFDVPTCDSGALGNDFGDDGILQTAGNTAITGCQATYPAILNFRPADMPGGAATFARDAACVATLGTGGCGFEQQLEAILKALTPTAAQTWTASNFTAVGSARASGGLDLPFYMNTQPHGDRENQNFSRDNSVLAIIPVTDEEDCSAHDEQLFNPSGGPYNGTDLNLRCFEFPEAQFETERYVNGFLQLRARPNLIIYAPITGIPLDLAPEAGQAPNYNLLIGPVESRDPRMVQRVDSTMMNRLVPSCNVPGRGVAFPPVRIVEVARGLATAGANVTVQSICQESFRGALREIIRQITSALGAACLPRPLNREADNRVNCDVIAVLGSPEAECSSFGASPKMDDGGEVFEDDRPVCVIQQIIPDDINPGAPEPTATGWYYDDFSGVGQENCGTPGDPSVLFQRIAFSGMQPPSGAEVRLECFLAVEGGGDEVINRSTFCDPQGNGDEICAPADFVCDPIRRACDVGCESDVDCVNAGLTGFVCDNDRTLQDIDPDEFAGNTDIHNICVNPTCGG
jgi:hypothetical protein